MFSPLLEKTPLAVHHFAQNGSGDGTNSMVPHVEGNLRLCEHKGKQITVNMERQPVVHLPRLCPRKLSSLPLPSTQIPSNEDESSKTSDKDELQEVDDLDVSLTGFSTSHKRRKLEQKEEKLDATSPLTGSITKAVQSVQTKASTKRKESNMMEVSNKGTVLKSALIIYNL